MKIWNVIYDNDAGIHVESYGLKTLAIEAVREAIKELIRSQGDRLPDDFDGMTLKELFVLHERYRRDECDSISITPWYLDQQSIDALRQTPC